FSIEDTDPGFIYSYPSSVWKYGVNENFELRLNTHIVTIQREPNPDNTGFLPISAGFKTKLTEQHGLLPKIAFIGEMTFPGIVDEDLETTYLSPNLILTFNHAVSGSFNISYDLGAVWDGFTGEPNFLYSLEPSFNITPRLGIFGELYGSTPQREEGDLELRLDAGLTYLIGNDLLLDVSAGQGLTEEAVESFVEVGISYRFKL
ncbi:MAG TPA: transporter, partial [Saprospiraceae bacterium]|nr:transporter [Saprospiraceae bacterium]